MPLKSMAARVAITAVSCLSALSLTTSAQTQEASPSMEILKCPVITSPAHCVPPRRVGRVLTPRRDPLEFLRPAMVYYPTPRKKPAAVTAAGAGTNKNGSRTAAGSTARPLSEVGRLNNSAVRLASEKRYEEAVDLLLKALVKRPNSSVLNRNLSVVYEDMKRFDAALSFAEAAVRLAPKEPLNLQQLCGLQLITGKPDDAVGCYKRLSSIRAMDLVDQTYYGVALYRSGKLDAAITVLEKAVGSPRVATATLNALGYCYYQKTRFDDAVSAFKHAIELRPDQPLVRFNLAIAQLAGGNREGALSQYKMLQTESRELADKLFQVLFRGKVVSIEDLK